jgi:hypothetical protein
MKNAPFQMVSQSFLKSISCFYLINDDSKMGKLNPHKCIGSGSFPLISRNRRYLHCRQVPFGLKPCRKIGCQCQTCNNGLQIAEVLGAKPRKKERIR